MPYRLAHMMIASGLAVAFLVAGISAYRWRRGDRGDDVRLARKVAGVQAPRPAAALPASARLHASPA